MTNGNVLVEERLVPRSDAQTDTHQPALWLPTVLLSVLAGVAMLGSLIILAGPWAVIANTRFLAVLIAGGVVKYHDRHAGFIQGVPNHEYYIASQDPVNWALIAGVIGIYLLIAVLKALQFHTIARSYGLGGSFGVHARAALYGQSYRETMPFGMGDAATSAALQASGAAVDRARAASLLAGGFVLLELVIFALIGLLGLGWTAWLTQVFWALVILGVLALWVRREQPRGQETYRSALQAHAGWLLRRPLLFLGIAALSLAAFGLRDVAAYLTAMSFSTQNVLLNIDPSLMLMGVVAGYTATLIRLTPGGIGQFEWGFTAALFIGGVGLAEAATVALLVSVFRYAALLILNIAMLFWRGARTSYRAVTRLLASDAWQQPGLVRVGAPNEAGDTITLPLPAQPLPAPARLWFRSVVVALAALSLFLLDQLTVLLADMWLVESLGLAQIFAVNIRMAAMLFVLASLLFSGAVVIPALRYRLPPLLRRSMLTAALPIGLLAGYLLAQHTHEFLIAGGVPFDVADPVFGNDISFYVFTLPALQLGWMTLAWLSAVALVAAVVCAAVERRASASERGNQLAFWLGAIATPWTQVLIIVCGIVAAFGFWLSRFQLLYKDNYDSSIFTGAEYVDVVGLFSTLNQIYVTALVALLVSSALLVMLRALRAAMRSGTAGWNATARRAGMVGLALVGLDFAFAALVAIRDTTLVRPNQPVIQLPYIERHIDATRAAYNLDRVEVVELTPRGDDAPLPDVNRLLNSPTIRNAPLWPSHVSYLERLVDPQHAARVMQTGGDTMIYGPTLEIFRQQQKLRTYYNFLDIDTLRFDINGEKRVFASAVRELPILEPQPWLAWWGQRFMLFTHGHGMVMAPVSETNAEGEPLFASYEIPVQTRWPELAARNQQVYYGEGAASMAISNVQNLQELDYPTNQGRAENVLPADVQAGVHLDSPLKRLVFAWRSGEFFELLFSALITPDTRLHYYRQPLERLQRIAPFLYFDSNPYATIVDGEIVWIANAMTTSDRYPYSKHDDLGDKAISRSITPATTRRVNYVEDSVKATVNAYTGQVQLYTITDAPMIRAWAQVYPDLFQDGAAMPAGVRQQLTYPLQLFHTQFDDLYIYYHMDDPTYFFNMEDMWDDADEVLGPVMDKGRAITFSIEPQPIMLETGGVLPASSSGAQFALVAAFTPEGARNLRAIPIAYQDGEDYGRLVVLQVPKGRYVVGPEQADSIIDQDPDISQQIAWWNRMGNQVIRGHTSLLLIDDEVFYIEPIFIRSEQNPITQLKRVVTVFRGQAYMAETLEEAIRQAVSNHSVTASVGGR